MKLHLPLSLRSALLAVLAVASLSYANDRMQATEGNIPTNSGQSGARDWWSWTNITKNLTEAANSNTENPGYITGDITFTFDVNVVRDVDNSWVFVGNMEMNLSAGTFNHYEAYLGRNSNVTLNITGGTYNILDKTPETQLRSPEIGYGADSLVTIKLQGGTFVMNNVNGRIARNEAHADITVGNGSVFSFIAGNIAQDSGSSADIIVESGGHFNMSGGHFGSMTGSSVTNTITIKDGGAFTLSGGILGDYGRADITVESGGTFIVKGGSLDAMYSQNLGYLKLEGNGNRQVPEANTTKSNAALLVMGTVSNEIKMHTVLTDNAAINTFDSGSSITFGADFSFNEHTLTKLGQGNITFGSGFTANDTGAFILSRGTLTLDYNTADTLSALTLQMGLCGNTADPAFGLILGSKSYILNAIQENGTGSVHAMISGSGTIIIDYSGTDAMSSSTGMSGGTASLEKRGSGSQALSGSVDAKNITVTQGTLTLGSSGQDITLSGTATSNSTLHLAGNATVDRLAGSGDIYASGSLAVKHASGSTSLTLRMADGGTLDVQGGTLTASALHFAGSGTLSVSLTGGAYLNFADITVGTAGAITLTLTDEEISSLISDTPYALFTHWDTAWGDFISMETTHIGRNEVSFDKTNGSIILTAGDGALRWTGGNLTWADSASATDQWQVGNTTDRFYNGDSVDFDSTGGTATISGRVVANEMRVTSGTWVFNDTAATDTLRVVSGLTIAGDASATFNHANLSISGGVQSSGELTFAGAALQIDGGVITTGGSLYFTGARAEVQGLASIADTTVSVSSANAVFSGGLSISGSSTADFTGASLTIAESLSIQGGTVTFSGRETNITGSATISGNSEVTFSGYALNLAQGLSIGSAGSSATVHLKLNGTAPNATAADSPTLGVPASGRSLGKVSIAAGSKLVVYGYDDSNRELTYTWKQNTYSRNYTYVSGGGTVEFRDQGYQVLSGASIYGGMDQNGQTSKGSALLFRFISQQATADQSNTIHIVELSSSTKGSAQATSLAFDRGDPANGWNPATAMLKHIDEIHVKDGAALGFTARNITDSETGTQAGIQSGAKVFETTHGVLHLAGTGTGGNDYAKGGNGALYVNTESSNLTITVSMPWDIVLDADTQINPYTATSHLSFTGSYNGGTHTLTKVGQGNLILGEGFTTKEDSSGTFAINRGNLVFFYTDSSALEDYTISLAYNANQNSTLSLQGGLYTIRNLTGNGQVTGSGTLDFAISGDTTSTFSADVVADGENRVSLKMSGSGTQSITGGVTVQDVTVLNGTLTLGAETKAVDISGTTTMSGGTLTLSGATTMDSLAGTAGSIAAEQGLSIGRVQSDTQLTSLSVADGNVLEIGGGTLKGGSLSFLGNATLKVNLENATYLDFDTITSAGNISIELSDLYLPDDVQTGEPYRLFTQWNPALKDQFSLATTKLGRLTVKFDGDNGTITVTDGERADLIWNGEGENTAEDLVWESATDHTNWTNEGISGADSFYNGDNVTFDAATGATITLKGSVMTGNMTISEGSWTLVDNAGTSNLLVVGSKLTLSDGTGLTLRNASTTLRGDVELQSGASLTVNSTTTQLEGVLELSGASASFTSGTVSIENRVSVSEGGTLSFSGSKTSLSGATEVTEGSLTITGSGSFTNSGSIALGGDAEKAATMTVQTDGNKTLGEITLNEGGSLVLFGYVNNADTRSTYQAGTSISGAGELHLRNFGYNTLNANGGLLADLISGSLGALHLDRAGLTDLTQSTVVDFTASSQGLDALLNSIGSIYVGSGNALGFSSQGSNAMANSSGVLHLAGGGAGFDATSDNWGTRGSSAALYINGALNVALAWDVVLDAGTTINTIAAGSALTLSGTYNGNGYKLIKNGQGSLVTDATFTTKAESSGTISISRGGMTLGHSTTDALKNYTIELNYNASQNATLTLKDGTYAIKKLTSLGAGDSDQRHITGSGTLVFYTDADTTAAVDVIAASDGGRVSLTMKGSSKQALTGSITAADITVDSGTLELAANGSAIDASGTVTVNAGNLTLHQDATIGSLAALGGTTTVNGELTVSSQATIGSSVQVSGGFSAAQLTTGEGSLQVGGDLSIGKAVAGSGTLGDITVGGSNLSLGGGTLKGGVLSLTGKLTVTLANNSKLHFDSITTEGIKLELADAVLPAGYKLGDSYQLFENWDADTMAELVDFEHWEQGRMSVDFDAQTGKLIFSGVAADLIWHNDDAERESGIWQNSATDGLNWDDADGVATGLMTFISGDNVSFDSASGGAISLRGSILAGNMKVLSGAWTYSDDTTTENHELSIGGTLTVGNADGSATSAEFTNASTSVLGDTHVLSGAALTFSGKSASLAGGTVAGELVLSGDSAALSGELTISGSLEVSGTGSLENTGSITLQGGSAAISATGTKTLGTVTVGKGSSLVITGADTNSSALFSNSFTKNTEDSTVSSVSGEGTLELNGVYRYMWNAYSVVSVDSDGGLLAAFFPAAESEVGKGKLGQLKLTQKSALGFASNSQTLKNILSHVDEIYVTAGSSLGFTSNYTGNSADLLAGTTGTLRLAGNGTGRGSSDASGKEGALFVSGGFKAKVPWDVIIESEGATVFIPSNEGDALLLTGALTTDGAVLSKTGNGELELGNGFSTKAAAGKAADSGTIALKNGTLTLSYGEEDALAEYTLQITHSAYLNPTLQVESVGTYRVKRIVDSEAPTGNKQGVISGSGTLIIDSGDDTSTASTAMRIGGFGEAPSLTLVKEGAGEQKITGQVSALAVSVKKGTLSLGSNTTTVTVKNGLSIEAQATLTAGGNLTVGTLTGKGTAAASGERTLTGDITAFTGTLKAATGSQWQLVGEQTAETTVIQAAVAGALTVAYETEGSVLLSGGAQAGSTISNAMAGTTLTLTGTYSDTTLGFAGNTIELGTASAAGTLKGSTEGTGGALVLVNGTLGQAYTGSSHAALHVAALGAVNAGGTSGSAFDSIAIYEGGHLSGVSGDIRTSSTSVLLTFDEANMGKGSASLIESSGKLVLDDTAAFSIGFTTTGFAEVLKAGGKYVYLHALEGGQVVADRTVQLKELLADNYGQLLGDFYKYVDTVDGYIIISGDATGIYLVLADGSRDSGSIGDYHALDNRIATVVDENTTLDVALGDNPEGDNSLTVNNLVGLKGSTFHASATGSEEVTIVLNNANQGIDDAPNMPGNLGPEDLTGIDTEFLGMITGEEGVNFRKTGAGTLYVGTEDGESGGMEVAGDVSISEGSIVVRGKKSSIGSLSFDYADESSSPAEQRSKMSSVRTLSFDYADEPASPAEQRGICVSGGSLTVGELRNTGSGSSNIYLENQGVFIYAGNGGVVSGIGVSGRNGSGTFGVQSGSDLTLEGATIDSVNVNLDGGELTLQNSSQLADSDVSIDNDGALHLGDDAGISGGNVEVQSGSLTLDDTSSGIHTSGDITIGEKGLVDLGGSASSVGRLNGSGELKGNADAALEIQGNGSEFSGMFTGGGTLYVGEGADLTLKDVQTSPDEPWNAHVSTNGSLTIDVQKTNRETNLGDIVLEDRSELIYKYDTGHSSNMNAHIVLKDGASANFTIYSDGKGLEPNQDLELSGLSFTGNSDDLTVKLKGKAFVYYEGDAHLREGEQGMIVELEKLKSNAFLHAGMHTNARAGALIFWDAFDTQGDTWAYMQQNPLGALAMLTDEIYARHEAGAPMDDLLAAGAGASVAVLGSAMQEDLRRQLNTMRNRALAATEKDGVNMWVTAEGSYHKLKSVGLAPGYTLDGWGGSVGADTALDQDTHVGLSLSAMYNNLKTQGPDASRGHEDTWYLSAFARTTDGAWSHTLIITGGKADLELNRTVNYGSGSYTTHGSTDGYVLGAMYEVAYSFALDEKGRVLQPLASAQWRHISLNGYSESGSDAGLRVSDSEQDIVTLGLGARLATSTSDDIFNAPAAVELRALVKTDLGDRRSTAQTALIHGGTAAEVEAAAPGKLGFELGVGLSLPLGKEDGVIFAEGAVELRPHYTQASATLGYRLAF